jgi:hypothetical protein
MPKQASFSQLTYELGPCPICNSGDAAEIAETAAIQGQLTLFSYMKKKPRKRVNACGAMIQS